MVRKYLKDIPNLDLDKIHVRRFARSTVRSYIAPIVVRFSTSAEVIRVVTYRNQLPQMMSPALDFTPFRRSCLRQLLAAASKHNTAHLDKSKARSGSNKFSDMIVIYVLLVCLEEEVFW
ncbi:hypothetical protein TSAR_007904 [Trichomalopsis sarcophagae]|uniref:Uncharacterized protein n=1 Tax=Trichomalopsis sarcophagae TaxID=543379 RepID=A0A232FMY1_9HYME|nr:hypothetical protein TSAR_007904 [Trichomalopsis sarcophagae]